MLRTYPGCHQFVLVKGCPFLHKTAGTGWKPPLYNPGAFYLDDSFMFTVERVKMRWIVVAKI